MRKTGVKLLCMLLLFVFALGFGLAEEADHTNNPLAIDMVIVIQNNTGMVKVANNRAGLDKNGLRFDAAASLISMCDVKYSRACYFMFAKDLFVYHDKHAGSGNIKVVTPADITLLDISVEKHRGEREKLISELTGESNSSKIFNEHTTQNSKPDIAAAFEAAVEVQTRNPETKGNRKVIVLLMGGEEATQEVSDRVRAAKQKADENGVEVYAVSLNNTMNAPLLQTIVSQPDNYQFARTPEEFLMVFRNFFADMIGSEPQKADVRTEGKNSVITITIPNESVREVNIILPLKQVGDPELKDPNGSVLTEYVSENLMKGQGRNFINYKLINPIPGGYTLTYTPDGQAAGSSVDVQYVFSYDISLSARSLVNGATTDTMYKSDTLRLESYFTSEDGKASQDATLYQQSEDPRWNITASWEIYKINDDGSMAEKPVKPAEAMTVDPENRMFTADINLRDAGVATSGNYKAVITATGAGMDRRVEIPIVVLNHEPQIPAAPLEYTFTVNKTSGDPDRISWRNVHNIPLTADANGEAVSLQTLFSDQDGDKLSFRLEGADDKAAVVKLDLGDILCYSTQDAGGKVKPGTAEYILHYTDNDPRTADNLSIPVRITINSEVDKELEEYVPELTASGSKPAGAENSFLKNSRISISLRLKEKNGNGYAGRSIMEKFAPEGENTISITDSTGRNSLSSGSLTLNEAGDAFVYEIEDTGNKAASLEITAGIGLFEKAVLQVTVPNDNAPGVEKNPENVNIQVKKEKVPAFLQGLVGAATEEEEDTASKIKLNTLFADADGDVLTYSAPTFVTGTVTDDKGEPAGYIHIEPADENGMLDGNLEYTIVVNEEEVPGAPFSYTFVSTMTITATDGDGKTGILQQKITVEDLYNKMLTYVIIAAAAIAALVLLILIIHQIRKPVFPKLNMTIREEPSLYESGSEPLSPVKKPTNVNAIGVDGDMAEKHRISMKQLQNIIVKPIRSRMAVGVTIKSIEGGHKVSLDDVEMKAKKTYTWAVGQDLSIQNVNGDGLISIKLENRIEDGSTDLADEFGGNDSWSGIDSSMESSKERKRSRKISRKAKPVEEEKPADTGTDDFDF